MNLFVRPVALKSGPRLAFVWRHATRDVTKNHGGAEALRLLVPLIGSDFQDAHLFTTTQSAQLQTGPGKSALRLSVAANAPAPPPGNDRRKARAIRPDAPWLAALGVTDANGRPVAAMADKFRQIERFAELLGHLLREAPLPKDGRLRVFDMGCGKAYLTFATSELLGERGDVCGVEERADLVELCRRVAVEQGFGGRLSFRQGSIADTDVGSADILIALHACDTATDDALAKGVAAGAALLVVAPCCQKEIRPQLVPPAGPRGRPPPRRVRGAPGGVCDGRPEGAAPGMGGLPDAGDGIRLDGAHGQERDDRGRQGRTEGGRVGRRADPRIRWLLRSAAPLPGHPPGLRAPMTWTDLDWASLDRHRDRFLEGKPCDGPYWASAEEVASYDATFGERIGWKWDAVLEELRMRGWAPLGGTVLDWGCGSGIAGRRVVGFFGPGRFDSLVVWDHSPVAADFAHGAAARAFPGFAVAAATRGYLAGREPIGVLVLSHVLNELGPAALEEVRALVGRSRAVIWTEPGSPSVSRALGSLRDEWARDLRVVAPCTHARPCPVLAAGKRAALVPPFRRASRGDFCGLELGQVRAARGSRPKEPAVLVCRARPRLEQRRDGTVAGHRPARALQALRPVPQLRRRRLGRAYGPKA